MQKRFTLAIGILIFNLFSIPFLVSAQTGPGGVGNGTGSGGQPRNRMWLRADAGVFNDAGSTAANNSDLLWQWNDQSSNSAYAVQATAGNRPTYLTNVLNGLPVIRFNGTSSELLFDNRIDNTNALPMSFFAVTRNTTNPLGLFDSRPNQGDVFRFYSDGGANNSVEFWNQSPYKPGLTLSATGSVISVLGTRDGSSNRQLDAYVSGSQIGAVLTPSNTTQVGFTSSRLGSINTGTAGRFNGDLAEVVLFSTAINAAQRIIVENYLGAKYGITLSANDYFANTTYTRDLIGIGTTDGAIEHSTSNAGALLLTESSATLDAAYEFVFAGHDGTAHSATSGSNLGAAAVISAAVTSRWAREYRIEKTGTADVTIGFDYAQAGLTRVSGTASDYVLLYRASNGCTQYSIATISGSPDVSVANRVSFTIADANLANGFYTLGLKSSIPATTLYTFNTNCSGGCNFETASSWTTDATGATSVSPMVPRNIDNFVVLTGNTVSVSNSIIINTATINSGGTLDLGAWGCSNITTLNGAGTLRLSTSSGTLVFPSITTNNHISTSGSTVEYNSGNSFALPSSPSTYRNLTISSGGTKTISSALVVEETLLIQPPTTFSTNSNLNLNGNLVNNGQFNQTGGTTTFGSSVAQSITGSPILTIFNNLTINNSGAGAAGTVSSTIDFTITGNFISSSNNTTAFDATNGSILLSSSSAQSIGGTGAGLVNFYNLSTSSAGIKTINRSFNVSNSLTINAGSTFQFPAGGTAFTLILNGFTNSGTFNMATPGTASTHIVNVSGNMVLNNSSVLNLVNGTNVANLSLTKSGAQTISGGSPTTVDLNNLSINSTSQTTLSNFNLNVRGNLTVNGTLDLGSQTANRASAGGTFLIGTTGIVRIGGTNTFPSNYTTNTMSAGSTVEYYGTNQTIRALTYSNLTTAGGGTKTLGGLTTVAGILSLTNGLIDIGANNLDLGAAATVSGTPSASNMILANGTGLVRKYFNANGSFTFPFGTTGVYSPATISFTATTFTAPVGSRFIALRPVSSVAPGQLDASYSLAKYWDLSSFNIAGTINASFTFTYNPTEANADPTIEGAYIGASNNGTWITTGTVNTVAKTISFSGITSLTRTFTAGPLSAFARRVFYSRADGNFESGSTWSTNGYAGAASVIPPTLGSQIVIGNSRTVTVTAGTKNLSWLIVNSGAVLNLSTFTGITLDSLKGAGTIQISATGGTAVFPTVTAARNTFISTAGSTVEYYGTSNYNLPVSPASYTRLAITGAGSTKLILATTFVSESLVLNSGFISLGNLNLDLGVAATVSGTPSASNMILANGTGLVRKYFNANGSFTFPFGTTGVYSPATISFTATTFTAPVGSRFIALRPVSSVAPGQLDASYSLAKYWDLSSFNIAGTINASFTFTYNPTEANADPTIEGAYIGASNNGTWITTGTVNTVAKTISFSGITSLTRTFTAGPLSAFARRVFYSRADGNFESGSTWSTNGYAGAASVIPPTLGSQIVIGNSRTVTVTAGTKNLSWLIVNSGAVLNLSTFTGITLDSLKGAGTIQISATGGTAVFPTVTAANNTFITTAGNRVEYYGTGNYALPALPTTYLNLVLTGIGSTKTLSATTTVNTNLTFNSGILDIGAFNLQFANGATYSGTPSATNMVVTSGAGVVNRFYSAIGSFTYPIGTGSVYTPATLNVTSATFGGGGYLSVRAVNSVAPNQLDATYSLTKHWIVTSATISAITASLNFTYDLSERNLTAEPIYTNAYWNGAAWTTAGTVVSPTVSVTRTAVANLNGNFTAGPLSAFARRVFYSRADGSFESGSTWSNTGYAGVSSVIPPTLGSQIVIGNSRTVTVTAGTKNLSWLIVNSGSTLDLSTFTGITLDSLKGAGSLRISATGGTSVFPTVTAANNTFITTAGNSVEYYGTGIYSLPALPTTYLNLVLTGIGSTKTLSATTTVNTNLTFNSGILDIGAFNLQFANGATYSGTPSATNMVVTSGAGVVNRFYSTTGSFTYPIGTGSVYTPATINVTAATFGGGGYLSVRAVNAVAPNQLDASYSLTKHWIVTSATLSNISASLNFTYDLSERNLTAEPIYTNAFWNGSAWTIAGTVVSPTVTVSRAAVANLNGNFTAGPAGAFLPGSYYSRASGSFETASTWSTTSHLGTASLIPPTIGSDVYVGNGNSVIVGSGSKSIRNLFLQTSGILDLQSTTGHAVTGNFTTSSVNGTLKLSSGTLPTVSGINTFYTTAGNTVEYYGSGNYNLPSSITTYPNLTLSGSGTKTLQVSTTVNQTLTMNAGILDIAGFNLVLPIGSSVAGNAPSASNMIRTSGAGVVRRYFDNIGSFNFPIGTGSVYSPFNLTLAAGTTFTLPVGSRFVDVRTVNSRAQFQLDSTYSLLKHWVTTATNISNVSGSITATYDASEANSTPGVEAIYGSARRIAGTWVTGATSSVVSRVITFPLSASSIVGTWTAGPNVGFLPGTFFSFATGNYESAGTWSLTAYAGPVSPIPPTLRSSVSIGNNRVVTATAGSKTVPTVNIDGTPTPGTLDLQAFTGFNFASLTGAGTLKLSSGTFPTVSSNTFIGNAGNTVEYYGSGSYSLPSSLSTYRNLTLSGTGTKTLQANTTVNQALTMNSGILDIAGFNLILPVSNTVAGNSPSNTNMIRTSGTGVVRKYFDNIGSFNFPIGTGSVYSPFNLTLAAGTTFTLPVGSRFVDVRTVNSRAQFQLDSTYSLLKHWVTTATNISNVNGSITATYDASEANSTPGVEAIYGSARRIAGTWVTGATSSVVSRVITFPLSASSIVGTWTAGPNVGFLPGTFFSFATGNYESAGTWSLTAYAGPVSPIPPTLRSSVSIGNNRVVTATAGSKTVPTVNIDGTPTPGTLDLQAFTGFNFASLTGAGTLKLSSGTFPTVSSNTFIGTAGSTVEYGGTSTYTLPASPSTYQNLTISGAGNVKTLGGNTTANQNLTLSSGSLELAGNDLTVTGNSTISGTISDNADAGTNRFSGNLLINGTGSISTANNSPFILGGGITNDGTFNKTGTGAVTFNGTTQAIGGSNPIAMAGNVSLATGTTVQNSNNVFPLSNISIGQNGRLAQLYSAFPTSYTASNNGLAINTGFEVLSTSNNAGNAISSTTGDNFTFTSSGLGSVYGSRTIALSPAASAQVVQFDISTASTSATSAAATMIIGSGFSNNATLHTSTARMQVNLSATTGEFTITHPDGTPTTSATLTGTQTITWVINTSGSTITYTQPNGTNNISLATGKADVWAGNTRFANSLDVQTAAQVMNNLKFVFNTGVGSITLTNIRVNPIGTINTSGIAQTCYQVTPYDGDSITVSFTTPGTVTSSTHFNSGNTYTAQLSNASGSFTNPTTLGTLTTSALSGTIDGFIPANITSGTGYRVRVVSNNPIGISNNNGTNFTINQFRIAPAPSQVFTTTGSGSLLTATGLNVTAYQWGYYTTFGGPITDLTGRTSSTYTPLGSDFPGVGTYSLVCKMTTSGGCGINYSNYVFIYINCPVTANLAVNGDFSAGNTGFTSQYNYKIDDPMSTTEMYPEQTYAVVDNPFNVHNLFCNLNTPALRSPDSGGNMLVGNAATSGTLNLWTQNITVTPNRDYVLTFNAASLAGATSSLLFGIYTGCYRTGADISVPFETVNCVWNRYSFQFNSGNNTSIPLSIVNISAQASGNDIAIDDIVVYQCASVIVPPFNVANAPVWRGISSDWFNMDNWGTTCALPTCADDVYIPLLPSNRVYPAISATTAAARSVSILPGARLSVNSGGNLNVCGGFENLGILTTNANSSITFIGNSNPAEIKGTISGASKFGSIIINKTNTTDTVKLAANTEISSNFTITRGQFKAKGFSMKVGQDFSNAGTFIHGNNTVEFNGASNGIASRTGTGNFYNVLVNKTSASNTVTFSPALTTIQNQLNLTSGIAVTTGTNEISVTNSANNSVLNHSANSYVNGRIRRAVSGAGSYDFPVGDASRYELVNMNATSSLVGTSNILGFFTGTTPGGALPNLLENTRLYERVCDNGYWTLTPNAQPSAGAYNLTINPVGFTCPGPHQTIGKRANSGAAWTFGGSSDVSATQRNGYTSFSEFAQIDAEAPLPVTLVSFFGKWKNQNVELNWTTASEKDNDYFLVERSFDGNHFETIGRVNSKNAESDANSYRFDDKNPGSGLNVYRLKQFDTDGKFSYSKNITLTRNGAADFVKLMPNPGTLNEAIRIQILAGAGEDYKIQIVDMAGKMVISKLINTQAGLNEVEISSKNQLSQGMYTVHFIGINENASDHLPIKLIIQ